MWMFLTQQRTQKYNKQKNHQPFGIKCFIHFMTNNQLDLILSWFSWKPLICLLSHGNGKIKTKAIIEMLKFLLNWLAFSLFTQTLLFSLFNLIIFERNFLPMNEDESHYRSNFKFQKKNSIRKIQEPSKGEHNNCLLMLQLDIIRYISVLKQEKNIMRMWHTKVIS